MDYCYKRGNKQGKLGQKERKAIVLKTIFFVSIWLPEKTTVVINGNFFLHVKQEVFLKDHLSLRQHSMC